MKPLGRIAMVSVVLLAAMAIWYGSVVRAPESLTVGRAAAPWTDGVEYLDGAVFLAREGSFRIHVAGESHPSRYPPGFSLLGALAVSLGIEPAWVPHRTNQLGGLLLLVWTAVFWWRRLGPVPAAVATLLLATMPAFVILCRSPLSEVWATGLAVAGIWRLYDYSRDGSHGRGIVGTLLLVLSLSFRTSNVLLLPFLPAAVVARHGLRRSERPRAVARDLVLVGAAAVTGLVPLWVQNYLTFGHPLATGYDYWAPYWNASRAFQLQFVVPNLTQYLREFVQAETLFTTANLYGRGSYVGPAFVLLVLCACFGLRCHRRCWCFVAAAGTYFAAMTTYFFSDIRLLFPLFVLATPVAAAGWVGLWRRRGASSRALALGATGLLVAALVGWPAAGAFAGARADSRPEDPRPDTVAFVRETARAASPAYRLTRQLRRLGDPAPRLVITDIPSPYVHAMMPSDTWVAPLLDDHLFRFNPQVLVFGAAERAQLLSRALREGRSVWAVVHAHDVLAVSEACAEPDGFTWEVVTYDRPSGGGIARLVSSQEET